MIIIYVARLPNLNIEYKIATRSNSDASINKRQRIFYKIILVLIFLNVILYIKLIIYIDDYEMHCEQFALHLFPRSPVLRLLCSREFVQTRMAILYRTFVTRHMLQFGDLQWVHVQPM